MQKNNPKSEHGFTLVELAISIMIIGVLLGGVLKGQELLENARLTRTLVDLKGYKTALASFRATYNAIPGNMRNASDVIPDCAALSPCAQVAWSSRYLQPALIGSMATLRPLLAAFTSVQENRNFWLHMQKAGFIKQVVDSTGSAVSTPFRFGVEMPASPIRAVGYGALTVRFDSGAVPVPYTARREIAIVMMSQDASDVPLLARQAAFIDRKADDGLPYTGDVYVGGGDCAASVATDAAYAENSKTAKCELFYSLGF